MIPFALLMAAYIFDLLELGLIGIRGRIVLSLIGLSMACALVQCVLDDLSGLVGLGAGVVCVLLCRAGLAWLANGGARILTEVAWEGIVWLYEKAGEWSTIVVLRVLEVLAPTPTHEEAPVELSEPVPVPRDTAQVALPHGDRWGMLAPAAEGEAPREVPSLTPLPTYDALLRRQAPTSAGFEESAREAQARFGKSRRTFARDLATMRRRMAERPSSARSATVSATG